MRVHLDDIAGLLRRHRAHYRYLDVSIADVAELVDPASWSGFRAREDGRWEVATARGTLAVAVHADRGVARFEHVEPSKGGDAVVAGAALGALIGGALGSTRGGTAATAGAVLGLLVGGAIGSTSRARRPGEASPRWVFTLRYDEDAGEWRAYHGPYTRWAKEVLRAG